MQEDITTKLLTQATESINKLYDLVTRMDERVNTAKTSSQDADRRISEINKTYNQTVQRLASLEIQAESNKDNWQNIGSFEKDLSSLDRRIANLESTTDVSKDRWNKIIQFVIQLIWIVLAAWVLTKMNLQPPAVP